jgi:ribose 5-phosphate isomerase A
MTFVAALGERTRAGLRVRGVATSEATARAPRAGGTPLVELDEQVELDLTVDGADEVAPNLDLVKGWGGALVRERIVASVSRRQVILVGHDKLVAALGEHGRIPVEVIPFARVPVMGRLRGLGLRPTVRAVPDDGRPVMTENGNLVVDCAPAAPLGPAAARALEASVRAIAGVVDTGLFLGTAERVLVGYPDGRVETLGGRP